MYYYGSEIGITVNGTNYYYDLQGNQTANPDFNGVNLGTYNLLGGSSLTLFGAKVYVYRDPGNDYINTNNTQTIYWDVMQGSLTSYTAQQILSGGPSGSTTTFLGGNNFSGQNYNLNVNLGGDITTSGVYNVGFYIYGNASYDSGGQQYYNMNNYSNNGGANYIATITGYYGATATGTQASAFTGTGYFNFNGSGQTYTLNAANTYTGETQIDAGTVSITSTGGLSGSSIVYLGSGTNSSNAGLTLAGTTAFANNLQANVSAGAGTRTITKSDATSQTMSGTVTLNGLTTFDVASGGSLTLSGVLAGTNSFTKTNAGIMTLSGSSANTFSSGTVTVSAGTLVLNKSANTAAIAGRPVIVSSGATLRTDAAGQIGSAPLVTAEGTFDLNGNNQSVALNGAGTVKLDGPSSSGTLTITNSGTDTFSGIITDNARTDGAVTKAGTGTQILSGNSSYDGLTTVIGGVLRIGHANALGSTTGATTVSSGAALELSNSIAVGAEVLTLNGDGISFGGSLRNVNGNNSWAGNITNNSGARINSDTGTLTISGNITNAAGQSLYIGGGGNTTVNGTITGNVNNAGWNGALYKDGSGTLVLSANNTGLTGTIRLKGGTISVTNGNSLGTGALELGSGGTLTTLLVNSNTTVVNRLEMSDSATNAVINVASGATTTMSGVLSQTNGTANTTKFGKDGAGTLILNNGGATYNGQIQIGQGTVVVGASGALGTNVSTANRGIDLGLNVGDTSTANNVSVLASNGVTVGQSIYVAPNTSSGTRTIGLFGNGTNTFSNEFFMDGILTVDAGTSASDRVNISGAMINTGGLIKTGSGSAVLSGANTYSGGTTINQGTLALTNSGSLSSSGSVNVAASSGASSFDISGVTTSATIGSLAGGASGTVALGAKTLTAGGDNSSTTLSGVMSGSGGAFTKTGSGTQTFSGSSANTYTGVTTINSGQLTLSKTAGVNAIAGNVTIGDGTGSDVLMLGASDQIADTSVLTLVGTAANQRGVFRLNGFNETIGGLAGDGLVEFNGSGSTTSTLSLNVSGNYTNNGTIRNNSGGTGIISLVKSGSGTQVLTGANSYTGGTLVSAGVLEGIAGTSLQGNITNNATVNFNQTTTNTYSGNMSGTGILTKSGSGVVTLSGSNSYSGGTTLSAGTLNINSTNALGTGVLTLVDGATFANSSGAVITNANNNAMAINGTNTFSSGTLNMGTGAVTIGGTTRLNVNGDLTLGGTISGSAGFNKDGNGTLRLAGSNSFTSYTVVDYGTLELANVNALRNANLYIYGTTTNKQVTFGLAGNNTYNIEQISAGTGGSLAIGGNTLSLGANGGSSAFSGAISGTGGNVTKVGSGSLTLSGSNSYTGGTTLSAGTLNINSVNALGTGTLTLVNGATFANSSGSAITNANNNAIAINGTNTFSSGTLNMGTGAVTIGGATRLNVSTGGDLTLGGTLSGSASFNKDGIGTLRLSGSNSFTSFTVVDYGTLELANVDALCKANLYVYGTTANKQVTFGLAGNNTYNIEQISAGAGGSLAIGGNTLSVGANGGSSTFDGSLSGTGGNITKVGTGTLTLSGSNSYTGTSTINKGVLAFSSGNSLGSSSVVINSNAVLRVTANLTNAQNITVSTGQTGYVEAASGTTNTLNGTLSKNGSVLVLGGGGTHVVNGSITGTMANSDLVISNSTTTINSTNSYNGPTLVVSGGTLNNGINNALPTNTALTLGQAGETSGTTNTYNVSGYSQTVDSVATVGSGVNMVTNTTGTGNLTLNSSSAKSISGLTMGGANLTLTKAGANTVTLVSGNNISASTIAIQQGTLLLGAANQIGDSTAITLSGGKLSTAGYQDAVGKLTVTANSTIQGMNSTSGAAFTFSDIDLGNYSTSSGSTLTFLNSSGTSYALGTVIQLSTLAASSWTGYSETSLNNFSSKISFSDANLKAQINFGGGTSGTTLTVAAIPEPKVYMAAAGLVVLIAYAEVRRRRKVLSSKV